MLREYHWYDVCSLAVQLMHSQMTDFDNLSMKLDVPNKLLMAACRETVGLRRECLALHSLDAQIGMLAPR